MTTRLLFLAALALTACSTPDAPQQANAAASADNPAAATPAEPATTTASDAALTAENGVIVTGDVFGARTVLSLPKAMGSTVQRMPAGNGRPASFLLQHYVSGEDYGRNLSINLSALEGPTGTFALGKNPEEYDLRLAFQPADKVYMPAPGGDATLTISRFEGAGELIQGTFAGTFVSTTDPAARMTVKEGRFLYRGKPVTP